MSKKRFSCLACLALSVCLLAGCGKTGTKTKEGMRLIESLQYEEAMAAFDEAESLGEEPRLIARGRGIAMLSESKYQEAVAYFLHSLELSDGLVQDIDIDINYYLADAYVGMQELSEADSVYSSIITLQEDAKAYYYRGRVRVLEGSYTLAMEDFKYAIKLSPKDVDMVIGIYNSLAQNGYKDAGLEILQNTISNAGKGVSALDKGKVYYYMGEYQLAASSLEEARSADGDSSDAVLFLGKAYEAVGEYNYASNVYENYLARNPNSAAIYNQLALCEMKLGKYEDALISIQAGMQIGDHSLARSLSFNEIVIYEYLGEFKTAETLMTNYLSNYPGDEEALREQIFLMTR